MSTLETRIAKDISSAEFEFQAALRNSPLRDAPRMLYRNTK